MPTNQELRRQKIRGWRSVWARLHGTLPQKAREKEKEKDVQFVHCLRSYLFQITVRVVLYSIYSVKAGMERPWYSLSLLWLQTSSGLQIWQQLYKQKCKNFHLSPCNTVTCPSGFSKDICEQPLGDKNLEQSFVTTLSADFYFSNMKTTCPSHPSQIILTINPEFHCTVIHVEGPLITKGWLSCSIICSKWQSFLLDLWSTYSEVLFILNLHQYSWARAKWASSRWWPCCRIVYQHLVKGKNEVISASH